MFISLNSKWGWGISSIVIAVLILANQFGGFVELTAWSIVLAALTVALLIHSLITLNFAMLPIPIAGLYLTFQAHFGWPEIGFWTLALVAVLLSVGLSVLLPQSHWKKNRWTNMGRSGTKIMYDASGNRIDFDDDDDADVIYDGDENDEDSDGAFIGVKRPKRKVREGGGDNNPAISVQFGSVTRYLQADALETASLACSMGNLEVYFDNVTLSPNGAVVDASCSLGNIEIYLPKHWRVIDNLGASLGNAEVDHRFSRNYDDDDAPTITINGHSSLGNIEVLRIKGHRRDDSSHS